MSSATGRLSALWFRELQGGPACYRPFRVGCRPPALSTALGDVYSSTHSASGATGLPTSLVGHHFDQHSVQRSVSRAMCQCACWWWLFSGVSDVVTVYLQSFSLRRHGYATPFDFSEKGLKCCGFGSVRERKPLLQLPLTIWPFGACVGALFQRNRRDVLSPRASDADCRPFSTGRRRTALLAALCAVYSLLQSACRQSKPTLWDFCFGSHFILYVLISRALE